MAKSLYPTTHRSLAAYLSAKGYALAQWELSEGDLLTFYFEEKNGLGNAIQEFFTNVGSVHPQDFMRGLDLIRDIIREQKRSLEQRRDG